MRAIVSQIVSSILAFHPFVCSVMGVSVYPKLKNVGEGLIHHANNAVILFHFVKAKSIIHFYY